MGGIDMEINLEKKWGCTPKIFEMEMYLRMRERGMIVWITKDGKEVPINEMSDQHLMNAYKCLIRANNERAKNSLNYLPTVPTREEVQGYRCNLNDYDMYI